MGLPGRVLSEVWQAYCPRVLFEYILVVTAVGTALRANVDTPLHDTITFCTSFTFLSSACTHYSGRCRWARLLLR